MYREKSLESRQPTNNTKQENESQGASLKKKVGAGLAAVGLSFSLYACDNGDAETGAGSSSSISAEDVIYGEQCAEEGISFAYVDATISGAYETPESIGWQSGPDISNPDTLNNNLAVFDDMYENRNRIHTLFYDNGVVGMSKQQAEMVSVSAKLNEGFAEKQGPIYVYGYKELGEGSDSLSTEDLIDYGENGVLDTSDPSGASNDKLYEDTKLCVNL